MNKEEFKQHLRETVRQYLVDSGYDAPPDNQPLVDSVVGSALLCGIALMSDWIDDLNGVLLPETITQRVKNLRNYR